MAQLADQPFGVFFPLANRVTAELLDRYREYAKPLRATLCEIRTVIGV